MKGKIKIALVVVLAISTFAGTGIIEPTTASSNYIWKIQDPDASVEHFAVNDETDNIYAIIDWGGTTTFTKIDRDGNILFNKTEIANDLGNGNAVVLDTSRDYAYFSTNGGIYSYYFNGTQRWHKSFASAYGIGISDNGDRIIYSYYSGGSQTEIVDPSGTVLEGPITRRFYGEIHYISDEDNFAAPTITDVIAEHHANNLTFIQTIDPGTTDQMYQSVIYNDNVIYPAVATGQEQIQAVNLDTGTQDTTSLPFRYEDIGFDSNSQTIYLQPTSGDTTESYDTDINFKGNFTTRQGSSGTFHMGTYEYSGNIFVVISTNDGIAAYSTDTSFTPSYTVDGYVKSENGTGLSNAKVADNNGNNTTTDNSGYYSLVLKNGSYSLTSSKEGYSSETKDVLVTSDTSQNFTLFKRTIELVINPWMEHGSTQKYTVLLIEGENETDVTSSSTVQSNNTSVITVDSTNKELIATNDKSVAQRVIINATYDNQSVEENVTVANRTLENIDIMPPEQWIPSFLGFGDTKHGIGSNVQWILFIIFIMSTAARMIENPWAGVGSGMLVSILIWVLGYIALNVVLSTTFFGILAGLVIVKTRKQGADVTVNQ